jgi:hypothetical protein
MARDETYVIDLCDLVLGLTALRQHRFDFLRGDSAKPNALGRHLPADAYYPSRNLVIEYREIQHHESVPFWDEKWCRASNCFRSVQRRTYDQRRRDKLAEHKIKLIELDYFMFGPTKRLKRDLARDLSVVRKVLGR